MTGYPKELTLDRFVAILNEDGEGGWVITGGECLERFGSQLWHVHDATVQGSSLLLNLYNSNGVTVPGGTFKVVQQDSDDIILQTVDPRIDASEHLWTWIKFRRKGAAEPSKKAA